MKWRHETDYHGSRAYAEDNPPTISLASQIRITAGLLFGWIRRPFETLLRADARQAAEKMSLIEGKEKHYTVLGGANEPKQMSIAAIFPIAHTDDRRPRRASDREMLG